MKRLFASLSVACALAFTGTLVTAGSATAGEGEVCTEVIHHDAVPAVTHVVHHDAVTHTETVPDQRYSYTGGPQGLDANGVPVQTTAPGSDWQANTTTYNDGTSDGGHLGLYFVSHGGSGNGDWFFWSVKTVTVVDEEAYDETVVDEEAIPAYDETVEVACPTDDPTPTVDPTPSPTVDPTPPPEPKDEWAPSWEPKSQLDVGQPAQRTAHTGADVTAAALAMEGLGALGFGSMALGRRRKK